MLDNHLTSDGADSYSAAPTAYEFYKITMIIIISFDDSTSCRINYKSTLLQNDVNNCIVRALIELNSKFFSIIKLLDGMGRSEYKNDICYVICEN